MGSKNSKQKGYTTDLMLGWVTQDLGPEWLQWQQYAAEWLAESKRCLLYTSPSPRD